MTRREAAAVALAAAVSLAAVARAEHHQPARPTPTTSTTTTAARAPAPVIVALDTSGFRDRVTAAAGAIRCTPPGRALAWAEVAADGTILGTHATCETGP